MNPSQVTTPTQVCESALAVRLPPAGALPEEGGEQIGHELQGQKTVTGFAGRFGFAFTGFFVQDVSEFLVTRKQAQNVLELVLAA